MQASLASGNNENSFFTNEVLRRDVPNNWEYAFDNSLARKFAANNKEEFYSLWPPLEEAIKCCNFCSYILFSIGNVSVSEPNAASKDCPLCNLICRIGRFFNGDEWHKKVVRMGSILTIQSSGQRILRLCSNLGYMEGSNKQTQIGLPVLLDAGSPLRFALLREWLQWCDDSHKCNKHQTGKLPTRLLYVGDPQGRNNKPDFVKLVLAEKIESDKYIALSHCWGESEDGKVPLYCTTRENIGTREKGFKITDLPRTFSDAIQVVQGLNIKYLWIDSLCIIQGEEGDWEKESKTMEDVYASAYCTIAAASANNSHAGFLARNIEYIYVQDNLGGQIYVGTDIADFDNEVEKAQLNTRAWVIQERFLSRRTIHFGKNQMYWECGEGIYCEDLTQMKKEKGSIKDYKLDPNFPALLFRSGFKDTLFFLEDLLKDYSKRALSKHTDRAIALSGLVARIAVALKCRENYGVFGSYLHRNLLWQRCDLQSTMEQIQYKSRDVPSWSWMAYTGGIDFVNLEFGELDLFENLCFDQNDAQALITNIWKFQDCHLKEMEKAESEAARREILDSSDAKKGWILYDVKGENDFFLERGVVLGRTRLGDQREYHMLIVRQRDGKEDEYKRVGVGMVQEGYILRQLGDIQVF